MCKPRRRAVVLVSVLAVLSTAAPAAAQLDQLLKELETLTRPGAPTPGDAKIGAALKQALQVGTENAVTLIGRTDGYFTNKAIKILMPERLRTVERGLRTVGYGAEVDALVLSMNRAAERAAPGAKRMCKPRRRAVVLVSVLAVLSTAAPGAKRIFWDAIGKMTIDDAQRILQGTPTAATDYFKEKTSTPLTQAFQPIVERAMNEVGTVRQYNELLGLAKAIPFLKTESYDLDHYVVGKALDGLFHVVGEEERKIRTDPAARVTDLLREVFAK
jgi:Protein of unknown function (DUF4197)